MPWYFYKIFSALCYGASTQIDDYLVDRYSQNFGTLTLLIVSSFFGIIPALIFLIIGGPTLLTQFLPLHLLLIILAAITNFFVLFFYLKSLNFGEATVSIIFFRLVPVFALVGGQIFLNERVNTLQLIGIILSV